MLTIEKIDEAINENRRNLMARLHCNPECSARAWQNAWDRCPDLWVREQDLYRQRGDAQVVRDEGLNAAWKIEQRQHRKSNLNAVKDLATWPNEIRRLHGVKI